MTPKPALTPDSAAVLHTIATEQLVRAMSIMVEVEGMKAANAACALDGRYPAHSSGCFEDKAERIRGLADYLSGCLFSHAALARGEGEPS